MARGHPGLPGPTALAELPAACTPPHPTHLLHGWQRAVAERLLEKEPVGQATQTVSLVPLAAKGEEEAPAVTPGGSQPSKPLVHEQ